jgi:hypothetical protein
MKVSRSLLQALVVPAVVAAAAVAARADTVTYPGKAPEKLKPGQEVTGPAVINGANEKDSLTLRKGTVVRFEGTAKDEKGTTAESYFLKSGAVEGHVGFLTRMATPGFWVLPSKQGERISYFAESSAANTGYARAEKGSGLVRLVVDVDKNTGALTEVHVQDGQGVTVDRTPTTNGASQMAYTTDAHNDFKKGRVRVLFPLNTGLLIDLAVAKATTGFIRPGQPGKTEVANSVASWKSGKIRIATSLGGQQTGEGEIGPGVVAVIDNASGKIEIGLVKVDFGTLKAAVSLTSEFESLATSPINNVD